MKKKVKVVVSSMLLIFGLAAISYSEEYSKAWETAFQVLEARHSDAQPSTNS